LFWSLSNPKFQAPNPNPLPISKRQLAARTLEFSLWEWLGAWSLAVGI
jgi:hypothetical protein